MAPKFTHDAKVKVVEWLHSYAHMAYFAAVFVESHGVYGMIAGFLLVVSVAGQFLGESA